jgi:hypothetical protein
MRFFSTVKQHSQEPLSSSFSTGMKQQSQESPKTVLPTRGRSLTREGLQKLLLALAELSQLDGRKYKKMTAGNLRALFLSEENNFHPADKFPEYYSTKYADVFVSHPWDMCLIEELPYFLEEFEQWISPLEIGDKIVVSGRRTATIRFIGPTAFGKGEYIGAELDKPTGVHDGGVYGQVQTLMSLFFKLRNSFFVIPSRRSGTLPASRIEVFTFHPAPSPAQLPRWCVFPLRHRGSLAHNPSSRPLHAHCQMRSLAAHNHNLLHTAHFSSGRPNRPSPCLCRRPNRGDGGGGAVARHAPTLSRLTALQVPVGTDGLPLPNRGPLGYQPSYWLDILFLEPVPRPSMNTHARTHARTHTRTHAHTHARTHSHTHTHTHTHARTFSLPSPTRCQDPPPGPLPPLNLSLPRPPRTGPDVVMGS